MKNVLYLCSYKHIITNFDGIYNIVYNDIIDIPLKKDLNFIKCDALIIDFDNYDVIVATPPCNYYSRGNYRRETSDYSLKTKHLLPDILKKCISSGKPFLVENVRNRPMFTKLGLFDLDCMVFEIGRHTYWTNILFFPYYDFPISKCNIQNISRLRREGDNEVHHTIDCFLDFLDIDFYE